MIAIQKTANDIARLLLRYPSVSDVNWKIENGKVILHFTSTDKDDLVEIQRQVWAANVDSSEIDPEATTNHHSFGASTSPISVLKHGTLQVIGIHLAWSLHKMNILETAEANHLLGRWKGAKVGV